MVHSQQHRACLGLDVIGGPAPVLGVPSSSALILRGSAILWGLVLYPGTAVRAQGAVTYGYVSD